MRARQRVRPFADQLEQSNRRPTVVVTSDIVARMAEALLADTILNGTRSWDVMISRLFGLVLHAVLGSEGKEIEFESMRYEDVNVKLVSKSDGTQSFEAALKVHFVKTKKRAAITRTFELSAVGNDTEQHGRCFVCPITLLLVLAVRTSAVQQPSWESFMNGLRRSRSRTVVWADPKRPLLAKMSQISKALKTAADLIGMVDIPSLRGLRYGAEEETFRLPTVPVMGVEGVRQVLGLSARSSYYGGAEKFVPVRDIWQERLDSEPIEDFSPLIAPTPFKYRPATNAELEDICYKYRLDMDERSGRQQAQNIHRRMCRGAWCDRVRQAPSSPDAPENAHNSITSDTDRHAPVLSLGDAQSPKDLWEVDEEEMDELMLDLPTTPPEPWELDGEGLDKAFLEDMSALPNADVRPSVIQSTNSLSGNSVNFSRPALMEATAARESVDMPVSRNSVRRMEAPGSQPGFEIQHNADDYTYAINDDFDDSLDDGSNDDIDYDSEDGSDESSIQSSDMTVQHQNSSLTDGNNAKRSDTEVIWAQRPVFADFFCRIKSS